MHLLLPCLLFMCGIILPTEGTVCVSNSGFRIDCNICICSSDGTKYACTKNICHENQKLSNYMLGDMPSEGSPFVKWPNKQMSFRTFLDDDMIDPKDAYFKNTLDDIQDEDTADRNSKNLFKGWLSENDSDQNSSDESYDKRIEDVDERQNDFEYMGQPSKDFIY